jgi:hypothetical protein
MRTARVRRRRAPDTAFSQSVSVLDPLGQRLAPCNPARARQLLRRGRAWLVRSDPPLIQLCRMARASDCGTTSR